MQNQQIATFIRNLYRTEDTIALHQPTFNGNEQRYVAATIDSTYVSSIGSFVQDFEQHIETFCSVGSAVATVNGTAALHAALYLSAVEPGDLVLTQALTFVATCNAMFHLGVEPVFIDVSPLSLGLCPLATEAYLDEFAELNSDGVCVLKDSGRRIRAVVPMHCYGHPVQLDELVAVCQRWKLLLIEDAAEALGSYYKGRHVGSFGDYSVLSFNGNKVITSGGGGMLMCRDAEAGRRAKHITTTAKVAHSFEFFHDEAGFNYRMPNLNAALGCAQMEVLPDFLAKKRELAELYRDFFAGSDYAFVCEPDYAQSNYWLNNIICPDVATRKDLLISSNKNGIMTRPAWTLMHRLPMFEHALRGPLPVSEHLEGHLVSLPSTPLFD
jgi:aminotransferase in exopolysaccharide biosynthesis